MDTMTMSCRETGTPASTKWSRMDSATAAWALEEAMSSRDRELPANSTDADTYCGTVGSRGAVTVTMHVSSCPHTRPDTQSDVEAQTRPAEHRAHPVAVDGPPQSTSVSLPSLRPSRAPFGHDTAVMHDAGRSRVQLRSSHTSEGQAIPVSDGCTTTARDLYATPTALQNELSPGAW